MTQAEQVAAAWAEGYREGQQRPWVGLTTDEIYAIAESATNGHAGTRDALRWALGYGEQLLKDKNT